MACGACVCVRVGAPAQIRKTIDTLSKRQEVVQAKMTDLGAKAKAAMAKGKKRDALRFMRRRQVRGGAGRRWGGLVVVPEWSAPSDPALRAAGASAEVGMR